MPEILLGIVPMAAAVLLNSSALLYLGFFMTIAAGGDLMIVLRLLFYKCDRQNMILLDHPTACGFIIYHK